MIKAYANFEKTKIVIETPDYNALGSGVIENELSVNSAIALKNEIQEAVYSVSSFGFLLKDHIQAVQELIDRFGTELQTSCWIEIKNELINKKAT